jgi:hypothetical protein
MDPNTAQPLPNPQEDFIYRPRFDWRSLLTKKILTIILLFLGVLVIGTSFYYLQSQKQKGDSTAPTVREADPYKVIMKVGDEMIYQNDLDQEMALLPTKDDETIQFIKEKLIRDSILLQEAKKLQLEVALAATQAASLSAPRIIDLEPTIFGAIEKDLTKRATVVQQIEQQLPQKTLSTIEGKRAVIWFNNVTPGPVGYEKGKELAFQKISQLHSSVKAKRMTMEQAIQAIRSDNSLAQVDPVYQTNAGGPFQATKDESITFLPEFDTILWNTPIGGVTDIYTGSVRNSRTGQTVESLFIFGTITNKTESQYSSFEDWVEQKKKEYEITVY